MSAESHLAPHTGSKTVFVYGLVCCLLVAHLHDMFVTD